jgi:hypothetical protein
VLPVGAATEVGGLAAISRTVYDPRGDSTC